MSKKESVSKLLLYTVAVNVLIPKAGIKVSGIPVTVGSILLLLLIIRWMMNIIQKGTIKITTAEKFAWINIIYWMIRLFFGILLKIGNACSGTVSEDFSYFIALVVYPMIFFVVSNFEYKYSQIQLITKVVSICVIGTIIYSLIQVWGGIGNTAMPGR